MTTRELKLICTDFDGTIHDERCDPPIAVEFVEAVLKHQAQGAKWVINTGRELSSLLEELARSGIEARPDYLVVVEREIYIHEQTKYASHKPWNQRCDEVHARLFEALKDEIPKLFDWVNKNYRAMVYEDAWSPFCLIAEHAEHTEEIVRYLEGWAGRWPELAIVRNDVYARLSHVEFNKGTALTEVGRLCGARPEHIFAAGDHFNDVPMLNRDVAHGLGVPVNALPEIKQIVSAEGGLLAVGKSGSGVAEVLKNWLISASESDEA